MVILPEKIIKRINKSILPQWKVCFISAVVIGFIAHFYKITNWIPNWDSLVFRYDSQNMIGLGRWFLPVVCSFSSFYDLPFLNGIIAVLFHALGAVLICRILGIEKKLTAFLIGAVIASFPAVTSVMMYNYVADGYSIAFFMSCLAAWYMVSDKPKYILSALLIAFSSGIYQAYITVTITLVMFVLIKRMIFEKKTVSEVLKAALKMILTGIAGLCLYYLILNVLLKLTSATLLDYQGMSSTFELSNINLLNSLYAIKNTFVNYFFKGINIYTVVNICVFLSILVFYIKYAAENKVFVSPAKIIVLLIAFFMLLTGSTVLAFINPNIDYHNLMLMGYAVFYLFFVTLYEYGKDKKEKTTMVKCWTVFLLSLILISNQIVISNVSYHKAQMAYEKSYGTLIRIADRIEQTPGIENCKRILVSGSLDNSLAYSVSLPPEITGVTDGYIIRYDDESVGQSVFTSALNDYCGKSYEFISGELKKEILSAPEIKAMNKWPAKDCIAVKDDIVIVILGTEDEL